MEHRFKRDEHDYLKFQEGNISLILRSYDDLFSDFDGIPKDVDKTDFYSHDQNWSNRMILGDSLQVMASLAEREGLVGRLRAGRGGQGRELRSQ